MHDIILGVAFIAMIAAPAMVATLSGKKEYDPETDPETELQPAPRAAVRRNTIAGEIIRPTYAQKILRDEQASGTFQVATLPMYKSRGMANR